MRYESGITAVDDTEFGQWIDEARAASIRLATVVLGTREGADDVVQIAVERAWRARHSYDPSRAFRPWLLRIVANTARNDRRARGRRAQLALRARAPEGATLDPVAEGVVTRDDQRVVLGALNRLAAADREVIALRYFEELTEAEMATVLDCAAGTVKSRLSRAIGRLRAELEVDADAERSGRR